MQRGAACCPSTGHLGITLPPPLLPSHYCQHTFTASMRTTKGLSTSLSGAKRAGLQALHGDARVALVDRSSASSQIAQ